MANGRWAQSLQHFRFRHAEAECDRQLYRAARILKRPAPRIEHCTVGNTLPLKAADHTPINLTALQPQHPAPLGVRPTKAEPLNIITRVT